VAALHFSVPPVLREISGQALAGERIALVGPNGAGKSMLLMALPSLVLHRGDLIIDELQVARTLQRSLAGHTAYVGDAAPINAGTVEKNLRLGAPDASNEDIQAAVEQFELTSLSSRGERVGALGFNLSSGEQVRLMIARALLANLRILLPNEVEANLDAASEALMWDAVQNFPGLVIFATHDPVRAAQEDKVWRIHSGQLVE
jgi:ABC-type transport system involved in cytochrome bd biosynthesis fused ATPase/permease subunit